MAPLPPPPPPAPPPPLPGLGASSGGSQPKVGKPTDRNALLSQIRAGQKLKRTTQINDRSAPIVDGAKKASGNNSSQNSNTGNSVNTVQMQLEGLFSGGMPRLKPTGSKATVNDHRPMNDRSSRPVSGTREMPKQQLNQHRSDNQQSIVATSSIKASLEQQFNQQHRQQLPSRTDSGLNSNKKFNTVHSNKVRRSNTSFPSDVNIGSGKGPAPSVPSINKSGPPLPSKPPTVQRSNSQAVNKMKTINSVRTGPPNVKPPPPPKAKEECFPNSQLKPTINVNRRQSFGGSDSHTMHFTDTSQPPLPPAPPPPVTSLKPPPPPRNNSMPNGLSNHNTSQSSVNSRTAPVAAVSPMPQTPKMNHSSPRPALGPPPPPPPHRTGSTRNVNNSNSGFTSYPPPPPPQSSMPTKNNSVQPFQAPPPPVRHTSISKTDLESRFCSLFKGIQLLPAPDKFLGANKLYPSSAQPALQQQKRRIPPPPPPPPPSLSALPHAISPQLNAHHNSNSKNSKDCLRQPTLFVHLEPRLYPPGVGHVAQC